MAAETHSVEWMVSEGLVPYPAALAFMEHRAAQIRDGTAPECVWLLEHPPLYTAGTSADPSEVLDAERFPVYETGRGGRHTYHGPGQRVAYVLLDLTRHGRDVRAFVHRLEEWLIRTLSRLGVTAERREGRVGLWVTREDGFGEDKIAALGVRIRRWVSFHGISLNVAPDLEHFSGIVPCGIAEHGVTSLAALGHDAPMAQVDAILRECFAETFAVPLALVTPPPECQGRAP